MNVLFVNGFSNEVILKETNIIPRVGDKIGLFNYLPSQEVRTVLLWPHKEIKSQTKINFLITEDFDAIVMVS